MKVPYCKGFTFACNYSSKLGRAILLIVIGFTVCITWPLIIYWMDTYETPVMLIMNEGDVNTVRNESIKRILYWNTFFGRKDFYFGFGTQMFVDRHCNCTCETTNDRGMYNISTAIVFHIQDIRLSDMPKYRFAHQRWIFLLMEPPVKLTSPDRLHNLNNTFNWTMTYRHDSDIPLLYGRFQKKLTSNKKTSLDTDNFTKRTKSVMWVVSECDTWSKRELYARELSKYIDVDIYGHCGQSCRADDKLDACETIHLSTYKFYLAFENSLCRDYNTEKFYRGAVKQGPIPIVIGSSNYSAISPPQYYIDVNNFGSPKELADYLKILSGDADKYNEYNDWRYEYFIDAGGHISDAFCSLCQKLNNPDEGFSVYPDIYNWWITEGNCVLGDYNFQS